MFISSSAVREPIRSASYFAPSPLGFHGNAAKNPAPKFTSLHFVTRMGRIFGPYFSFRGDLIFIPGFAILWDIPVTNREWLL
jgi:hypothetical protein